MRKTPIERFTEKYIVTSCGCWIWIASIGSHGYGQLGLNDKIVTAHTFSYNNFIGLIPDGLELDHLCRNRSCVCPWHLETVPHKINMKRGINLFGNNIHNKSKTYCPQGHPYNADNTYIGDHNDRQCRICRANADKRYKAKRRLSKK